MLRLKLSSLVCLWIGSALLAKAGPTIAEGPYQPQMESLRQYRCPDWFRDAKFGIWSHWGPQAVPMDGDWYARHMYVPGHRQYQHHLANYGHPSTNGWKDIVPLWKAEKFDPDRLMALYKKAGAKYFVSMGVHHDNFDLWNSKYQPWNAAKVGPKRDIVGAWQQAARKQGLKFGVSEHLGASFWWWQVNKKSDPDGPLKGVPYDGTLPEFENLYHFKAAPDDTRNWYSTDPRWQQMWFQRIQDLVDSYHPDLLYTDGGVPFGNEVGLSLVAHYYNADPARQAAHPQVVYTCKQKSDGRWIEDLERGVMSGVNADPWQTDTSIGDWFYNRNWKFRPVSWTIHMLVDIVSKNGNLLLNVVQRPDGSLDPEVEQDLEKLATWIAVNGEGIYGTRPWLVHGEGPVRAKGGHFKEDFAYTARDIRFTTRGADTLFAFALGWPDDGKLLIRSLAKLPGVEGRIRDVKLLGSSAKVSWEHVDEGLRISLPAEKPCDYAVALQVTGDRLNTFQPALVLAEANRIQPAADGLLTLDADSAETHGNGIKVEAQGGEPNLGFWDSASDWASWLVSANRPGRYRATASVATVHSGVEFVLDVEGRTLTGKPAPSGAWDRFNVVDLGTIDIPTAGKLNVRVRPASPQSWKAINLRWIKLQPLP